MELSNSSVGAAVVPQAKSPLARIIGVFTSPRETLEDVAARPNFIIPLVLLMVVVVVAALTLREIGAEYALERMRNNPKIPPERLAAIEERMQHMADSPLRFLNVILAPVGAGIAWLVVAGAFMFGGNVIMGGEAKFKTIFSVTAWASLIGILESIVKTPIMLAQRTIKVTTSLALVLSPDAEDTFLYKLLNRFDIFTVWQLIVYTLGIAAIYKFSTNKSATVVVGLWVVWSIVYLAFSQLFGGSFGFGG